MGQVMEALHKLQAIERQLAEIRRDREVKAQRVARRQRQVRKAEDRLEENQSNLRSRKMKLDALQLDVAVREQAVDRHRQALNKAKTNKDYAAILAAMNTEKADNSKIETEILQLMEEAQNLETEAGKVEEERLKLSEDVAGAEKLLRAFEKKTKPQLDSLGSQRDEFANGLPPSTLATFNRVAERHDGEALASVTKLHPKRDDYICTGCNMKLTLDVINLLFTKDEIQICKVCARILYLPNPATQYAG